MSMSIRNSILLVAAAGRGSGELRIHFMNVSQGHGAASISPGGQVVLFADEVLKKVDVSPSAYAGSAQHSPERCA